MSIKLPAIAVAFDKLTEKLSLNTMSIYDIWAFILNYIPYYIFIFAVICLKLYIFLI
jgi:hypothetical protein